MCSLCDIENGPPEPEERPARPWLIREDVHEAVIDAVALRDAPPPDYERNPWDFLGWSDPVTLEPWNAKRYAKE